MASTNALGLTRDDYKGSPSTLCPGCGHSAIVNQIIAVTYEMGLPPYKIVKMSGIGCSSKAPTYFLGKSHGFNSLHGRMPAVSTGAAIANKDLIIIGVSGDGDSGSIGMGQFKHIVRRNVPMVYIIANNGVYGLTKGQFSATADKDQVLKYYGKNELPPIDLAMEAIITGATFVARSFSGDAKQMRTLLEAAFHHHGIAVLDIVSPCVSFNNRPESTKSYSYGKAHETPLHEISLLSPEFVSQHQEEITVKEYQPGEMVSVEMHDGTVIQLKKVELDYDPRNRWQAVKVLEEAHQNNVFLTGLLYYEGPERAHPTLIDIENLVDTPLSMLPPEQLRPSPESLEQVLEEFR